jgi:hypothetical protein
LVVALRGVDLLCINQDDTAERDSQVQIMRNIYARATVVVAWLGTPTEEIKHNEHEDLLKMMRHAAPILESTLSDYREKRRDGILKLQEKNLLIDIVRLRSSDRSLEQVINTLCVRLENFSVHESLEPDIGEALAFRSTWFSMTTLRLRNGRQPTLPWTGAIARLRREASDDRDYVYGQLGLFNRRVMNFLRPDYSVSVESVFISGTLALIKAEENLDILRTCCAGCKPGKYLLPSWCPDWSDGGSGCGCVTMARHQTLLTYSKLPRIMILRS